MERAIIHSDLKRESIQPEKKLARYIELLQRDINRLLFGSALKEVGCPVTSEKGRQSSFERLGMTFNISSTLENVYISPRPNVEQLRNFYRESAARRYWLTDLWAHTFEQRQTKIVVPQVQWIEGMLSQYLSTSNLEIGEYLPNHWGYYVTGRAIFPGVTYRLVNSLISSDLLEREVGEGSCIEQVDQNCFDAIFLFEALERSSNPAQLLQDVVQALKPGGLCFITCLLSSGFELQVLGSHSEIFIPPERMNILSYEGMIELIHRTGQLDIMEFSTPGILDIPNVEERLTKRDGFFGYILKQRCDPELTKSFQNFLQLNRLGTFGRIVLRKV